MKYASSNMCFICLIVILLSLDIKAVTISRFFMSPTYFRQLQNNLFKIVLLGAFFVEMIVSEWFNP